MNLGPPPPSRKQTTGKSGGGTLSVEISFSQGDLGLCPADLKLASTLPKLLLVTTLKLLLVTATENKLGQKLVLGVSFCCAESDNVDLGEDCGGLWIFGLEKPIEY